MNDYIVKFTDLPDSKGEMYWQLPLIDRELKHYHYNFEGKNVFCDCSEEIGNDFFRYFLHRFNDLKINSLSGVCYLPISEEQRLRPHIVEIHEAPDFNQDTGGGINGFLSLINTVTANKKAAGILCDSGYFHPLSQEDETRILLDGRMDYRDKRYQDVFSRADIVFANAPIILFPEYMKMIRHKPFVAFCTETPIDEDENNDQYFAGIHCGFTSAQYWIIDTDKIWNDLLNRTDEDGVRWTWSGTTMFVSNLPDVSRNSLFLNIFED